MWHPLSARTARKPELPTIVYYLTGTRGWTVPEREAGQKGLNPTAWSEGSRHQACWQCDVRVQHGRIYIEPSYKRVSAMLKERTYVIVGGPNADLFLPHAHVQ